MHKSSPQSKSSRVLPLHITGTDLLSLGELGGGVNSEKLENMMYFSLTKD